MSKYNVSCDLDSGKYFVGNDGSHYPIPFETRSNAIIFAELLKVVEAARKLQAYSEDELFDIVDEINTAVKELDEKHGAEQEGTEKCTVF